MLRQNFSLVLFWKFELLQLGAVWGYTQQLFLKKNFNQLKEVQDTKKAM